MLAKEIKSLQHPIVKTFIKLRTSRKFRYAQKKIVITGIKQIKEKKILEVLLTKKESPFSFSAKETFFVTDAILKKVTGLETPEPVAAIVSMPNWSSLEEGKWILGLDGINDPGNLGTLLRTALALGWEGAFLTDTCVDPFNEKALRAAKGATFSLPLKMGTPDELLQFIERKKMIAYIADMKGKPLKEISPSSKTLLILGNEAQGVSKNLKAHFEKICIPIKAIESLNVGAAGAILMYTLKS